MVSTYVIYLALDQFRGATSTCARPTAEERCDSPPTSEPLLWYTDDGSICFVE